MATIIKPSATYAAREQEILAIQRSKVSQCYNCFDVQIIILYKLEYPTVKHRYIPDALRVILLSIPYSINGS